MFTQRQRLMVLSRRPRSAKQLSAGAAFTLIEMLVVISIIALVAAIGTAFVAFSHSNYRLQATGNNMMSALRRARSEAMSTGAPVELELRKSPGATGDITLYPEDPIAAWEFDGRQDSSRESDEQLMNIGGALGRSLTCRKSVSVHPGPVGGAVQFTPVTSQQLARTAMSDLGKGNCMHELHLLHPAAEGFAISFSYWAKNVSGPIGIIYQKEGNGLRIGLTGDGRLVCKLGELTAVAKRPTAEQFWTDVRVMFRAGTKERPDRLTIHQNGRLVARNDGNTRFTSGSDARRMTQPLPRRFMLGVFPKGKPMLRIDRLRFSRIIAEELATIPKQSQVSGTKAFTFLADGSTSGGEIQLARKGVNYTIRLSVTEAGSIQQRTVDSPSSASNASKPSASTQN